MMKNWKKSSKNMLKIVSPITWFFANFSLLEIRVYFFSSQIQVWIKNTSQFSVQQINYNARKWYIIVNNDNDKAASKVPNLIDCKWTEKWTTFHQTAQRYRLQSFVFFSVYAWFLSHVLFFSSQERIDVSISSFLPLHLIENRKVHSECRRTHVRRAQRQNETNECASHMWRNEWARMRLCDNSIQRSIRFRRRPSLSLPMKTKLIINANSSSRYVSAFE